MMPIFFAVGAGTLFGSEGHGAGTSVIRFCADPYSGLVDRVGRQPRRVETAAR